MLVHAGIALGSNRGDRAAEIEAGFSFLRTLAADAQVLRSGVIETEPVDCPPGSAPFLNAVAEIHVDSDALTPDELLRRLQAFEVERGRPREHARHDARPLDLDLLYYGDRIVEIPALTLPHPRLAERQFVLEPLAQIRPTLVLPGHAQPVHQLLAAGADARSRLNSGMDREKIGRIERLAYQLWEQEGRSEGGALDNWLRAEKQLADTEFLENELKVEEEEGGLVPKVRGTNPLP